jgi:hypothetical protein
MEIPEAAILRSDLNPIVGGDYCTVSGKLRACRYGREEMALRRRNGAESMLQYITKCAEVSPPGDIRVS